MGPATVTPISAVEGALGPAASSWLHPDWPLVPGFPMITSGSTAWLAFSPCGLARLQGRRPAAVPRGALAVEEGPS